MANGVLTNGAFTGTLGSDTLSGMNGADLTGTGNDDSIDASAWGLGSVTIDGLGGNDAIQGGTSGDTLTGGTGNDTIDGNGGTDTIVETLGGAGSVVLTNTSLGGSLGTDTLTEIEQATINGSARRRLFLSVVLHRLRDPRRPWQWGQLLDHAGRGRRLQPPRLRRRSRRRRNRLHRRGCRYGQRHCDAGRARC